jgi:hypothetical protein
MEDGTTTAVVPIVVGIGVAVPDTSWDIVVGPGDRVRGDRTTGELERCWIGLNGDEARPVYDKEKVY